jgi:lipoyl(octanoyl) transferase
MQQRPMVRVRDLGRIDYKQAWDLQEELLKTAVDCKISNRKNETAVMPQQHLLFCEHPHVYTLGKSGAFENLLLDEAHLQQIDAQFYKINRGGDITYHGPGQLVMYPILDLEQFFTDIHQYLRYLEVWIDADTPRARKICAMGVKCSRWITMHGIALNVSPDLGYFGNIVPCGIQDKAVTSMAKELGREVSITEVQKVLLREMSAVFNFSIQEK